MVKLPDTVAPLPAERNYGKNIPAGAAFAWLGAGWRDLTSRPGTSLAYGLAVFLISLLVIGTLVWFELDYILFPALSGFMVMGPLIAIGLYEKSRGLEQGRSVSVGQMLAVRPSSGGQVLFTGVLLALLMLAWMRAAVLLYALFFGLLPFPGLNDIIPVLIGTPEGLGLLIVGSLVGGIFAAFSFAISVFSIPILLDRKSDAFTAMGTSMALTWNNLPVMLVWGAIVVFLFGLSVATGLLALILVFPLLGHATWHAYRAVVRDEDLEEK